jgi:hypothetical protein
MNSSKGAALAILRGQVHELPNLGSEDVERLIFAATTLARHELEPIYLDYTLTHLFSPHFPAANWAGVYGRVRSIDSHMKAVASLVERQGGLVNLQMPGLSSTVARIDIVEAGAEFHQPWFPCFWNADVEDLYPLPDVDPTLPVGQGFSRLGEQLPPQTQRVFQRI